MRRAFIALLVPSGAGIARIASAQRSAADCARAANAADRIDLATIDMPDAPRMDPSSTNAGMRSSRSEGGSLAFSGPLVDSSSRGD